MVSVFRPDAGDDFLFDRDLNVDIVAFFFRNLFVLGNINVFARLVRDFLAFLFVVVTGLALFSVSSFTLLLLLISACFCVFGNTFGYFNLFANLVMFCFVLLFVGFNFFLAFPVLFLARCVEMNIVALLFGYFFAHFMGDLFAVGYSVLTALFLRHVVAFGYIDI